MSQSATSVTIKWTYVGSRIIEYTATNTTNGILEGLRVVVVNAAQAPATPSNPVVVSQTCTSAVLQKSGSIPSGVMWYWQGTSSSGTSTSLPATSNYTLSSTGRYYLRARNTSTGVWSTGSSSVYVTLGTIGGSTWYADADGDNLGDPNVTVVQCSQPVGYVSNNLDQCPNTHGGGNSNGCPATAGLSNENYIYTITPQIGVTSMSGLTTNADALKNVTYYDGLGRAKQQVAIKQSTTEKDIVTHVSYDGLGRQEKEYLPYPSTSSNGYFKTDALVATNTYYKNTYSPEVNQVNPNPYSENAFEASPLSRVLKQAAPGEAWKMGNGHELEFDYNANTSSEVKKYEATLTYSTTYKIYIPTLTLNGSYAAGELYKTITKDENHSGSSKLHTTEEFKDKQGRVVLKRTYADIDLNNDGDFTDVGEQQALHDTYYVYDDYGNLTYVLPPKAEAHIAKPDATELKELCYQYKYDGRNRVAEKKMPGKGWEYIVYNKLDQPIMTQDANLDAQNKWLFTKYDAFGRVAFTGIANSSGTRAQLQTNADNTAAQWVARTTGTTNLGGTTIYYNNSGYPSWATEVLTVNYYDDYAFDLAGSFNPTTNNTQVYGAYVTTRTKGLATGSKVKVLGTSNWITTVSYYDERGREVYSYTKNDYLKTTDILKSKLDFIGKVEETTTLHTKTNSGSATLTTVDKFTYDHAGRLKQHTQTIDNKTEVIAGNTYDELGQLIERGVGGKNNQQRLQKVNYAYNIRGWLKGINQDTNLDNDLFNFSIKYNDAEDVGKRLYNGNISETQWSTLAIYSSSLISRRYEYTYDALNRITSATDNTGYYGLNTATYDKNGNIQRLRRSGYLEEVGTLANPGHGWGEIDNLTYSYDIGNRLMKVSDAPAFNDKYGFKDDAVNLAADTSDDYRYDLNGNLLSDTNKGIGSTTLDGISYNHLNLPTEVKFDNNVNKRINYIYSADGIKQKKVVNNNGALTTTDYAGNYIYENNILQFFNHPEGYATPDASDFQYVYQYKDHLGNIRLSYADSDNNGVVTGATSVLFDDNLDNSSGWDSQGSLYGASATIDDEHTISGTTAAKLTLSGAGDLYAHSNQWIPINNSSATDYIFSGWLYLDTPTNGYARISFFMNEDDETAYFTQVANGTKIRTEDKWIYYEQRVTVPSNIDKINLRINVYTSYSPGASAWFDNLRIRKVNSTNEVVEESNYYPFGLEHKGYNDNVSPNGNSVAQKFKYNGKELQESLGLNWYDYQARNYDPAIGRWMVVDPIAQGYDEWSPYNYTLNNPIIHTDPDGMSVDNEYIVKKQGGKIVDIQYVSDKGGNTTDYITEVDLDKAPLAEGVTQYTLDVEVEYTSGIGNDSPQSQTENPTPGSRIVHGKDTFMAALEWLLALATGGESKVATTVLKAEANKKVKREASRTLRKKWEEANSKKWPKEPEFLPDGRKNPHAGRNQSVSHRKALQDGGTNKVGKGKAGNIEPEPWILHHERHTSRGDFKRWAQQRAKQKQKNKKK